MAEQKRELLALVLQLIRDNQDAADGVLRDERYWPLKYITFVKHRTWSQEIGEDSSVPRIADRIMRRIYSTLTKIGTLTSDLAGSKGMSAARACYEVILNERAFKWALLPRTTLSDFYLEDPLDLMTSPLGKPNKPVVKDGVEHYEQEDLCYKTTTAPIHVRLLNDLLRTIPGGERIPPLAAVTRDQDDSDASEADESEDDSQMDAGHISEPDSGERNQGGVVERQAESKARSAPNAPCTELQMRILEELDGQPYTAEALIGQLHYCEVKAGERTVKTALAQLMKAGRIANKRGLGYYRPDKPPEIAER